MPIGNSLSILKSLKISKFLQLGNDINGSYATEQFGVSVDMNSTGNIIAVGSNNVSTKSIKVYSWDGTNWIQLGNNIFQNSLQGIFSLNDTGNRIAVSETLFVQNSGFSGRVAIYELNVATWSRIGNYITDPNVPINNSLGNGGFGNSVSMNSTGDRVAISDIYTGIANTSNASIWNIGYVRIYSYNGTDWVQLGNTITGEAGYDESGSSVSINSIGDIVAIGAPLNDGNGIDSGHVRIYSYNGTDWVQLGNDINGEAAGDKFGSSVSINSIGDRVAIGAPFNDGNGANSGHVRIYSYNGTDWVQLGNDINGKAVRDESGSSVSINSIGDRVAIGSPFNDGNGIDSGSVSIYSYNGTDWIRVKTDIDGQSAGDLLNSVSMNSAGNRVVIGSMNSDTNGKNNTGKVRVFTL